MLTRIEVGGIGNVAGPAPGELAKRRDWR